MSIKLKTNEEIVLLCEGGKRHAEILKLLSAMVSPGVSTLHLEESARRLVREGGDQPAHLGYTPSGAKRPFPAVLCISINDEIVHGIPNEDPKILKEGDIISLDLSIIHKGFFTDSAVTVPVGKIDKESMKLLEVTQEALRTGIASARPGRHIGDIGFAISSVVEASGFSLAQDLVGHGVGYKLHEDPYVPNVGRRGEGEKLRVGMVIAIEPMVNIGKPGIKVLKDGYTIATKDGSRSAHFEVTLAVGKDGPIVLTPIFW